MKVIKLIFFLLALSTSINLFAQIPKDSVAIILIADTALVANNNFSVVQILQAGKVLKGSLNEKINIKYGVDFSIDFINTIVPLPGYKKLQIYNDTTIFIGVKLLSSVIIKSKSRLVSENTAGFDYYPQRDSVLREKTILLGLQRLPFINGSDDQAVPKYRHDGKILFTINGKQRKGIENNWALILGILKGKDIYKVELIEDIPVQVRNQGYAAIINILTLEENIYGNSFNAVLFYDQRNNINTSASGTFLRKRFDISFNIGRDEDNQKGFRKTEVTTPTFVQSVLQLKTDYTFETKYVNVDLGFRKDSLRDFGLNLSGQSSVYSTSYTPLYKFGINTTGITDIFKRGMLKANLSYIFRKKKGLTNSLIAVINYAEEIKGNNIAFDMPRQRDSAATRSISNELYWLSEYNIQDLRNRKYPFEIGIKIYNRDLSQDYKRFEVENNGNDLWRLVYGKTDSFTTIQYSVRPYLKIAKNISQLKRLNFSLFPEIFVLKNSATMRRIFFVPNLIIGYRKIIDSKNSLRYSLTGELIKPNIDYLSNVQMFTDPQQQQIGNVNLRPSKYISGGGEWVRRKKATFSYGVNFAYYFDQHDFFRIVDTTNNFIQIFANNGLKTYRISNNITYQKQLLKSVWIDLSGGINFNQNKNKLFNASFNSITFYNQSNVNVELGGNNGSLSLRMFYNANPTNGQGYIQGTRFYGLVYANQIFKKKIAVSLIANQFFLKNRSRLNYSKAEKIEVFTYTIEPYRLLKIRLAYRFSDIKISKVAAKKNGEISGELPRIQ